MGRYKVTIEKPEKKPEEEKGSKKEGDNTRVPPEHPHVWNKQNASQDPPPLTAASKKLINNDIRGSTKKTYKSKVKAFADYCTKVGTKTRSCHPNVVIKFLTTLALEKGLSYQTICGYRSMIAKQHIGVENTPLRMMPKIKRLVRAIFIERPPIPRYTDYWDVNQVLEYLETLPDLANLSDMDLLIKTAVITFILTLSRFDNMNDDYT